MEQVAVRGMVRVLPFETVLYWMEDLCELDFGDFMKFLLILSVAEMRMLCRELREMGGNENKGFLCGRRT